MQEEQKEAVQDQNLNGELNRSNDSIPTDELTDLYNSSDDQNQIKPVDGQQSQSPNQVNDQSSKSNEVTLNPFEKQNNSQNNAQDRFSSQNNNNLSPNNQVLNQSTIDINQSHNTTQMLKMHHNISESSAALQVALSTAHPSPDSKKLSEIAELKHIIELQRQQLDRMQSENSTQQNKIHQLSSFMNNQTEEIQTLKKRLDQQNTLSSSNDEKIKNNRSSLSKINKNSISYNQKINNMNSQSLQQQQMRQPGQSTDFWKENDQDFYSTKNASKKIVLQPIHHNNRNAQILEQMKQELWVSKERAQQKQTDQLLQKSFKEQNSRSNANLLEQRGSSKKKDKIKSSTLKKVEKKIFNEDLVEIGDPSEMKNHEETSRVMSEQMEQTTENRSSRLNGQYQYMEQQEQQHQNPHKKNQSQVYESVKSKSLRRPMQNPLQIDKLEALKFKMSLQARNLKLIKEHDAFIRDIEKKQMGGKRENKLQTMQTVTRLYKDLERTQKQLRQELLNAQKQNGGEVDRQLIDECDNLFREADEYFSQYQQEIDERKVRKDYSKINSKINSNLKGIKQTKLIVLSQDLPFDENQTEEEQYHQNQVSYQQKQQQQQQQELTVLSGRQNSYFQSINLKNKQQQLKLQQQLIMNPQQSYVGDVGSSNYNEGRQVMIGQQQYQQQQSQKQQYNRERENVKLPDISNRNSIKNSKRSLPQY